MRRRISVADMSSRTLQIAGRTPVGSSRATGAKYRGYVHRPRWFELWMKAVLTGEGDLMALKPMNCPAMS